MVHCPWGVGVRVACAAAPEYFVRSCIACRTSVASEGRGDGASGRRSGERGAGEAGVSHGPIARGGSPVATGGGVRGPRESSRGGCWREGRRGESLCARTAACGVSWRALVEGWKAYRAWWGGVIVGLGFSAQV